MRWKSAAALAAVLAGWPLQAGHAQVNPEDQDIPDESVPAQAAPPPATAPPATQPAAPPSAATQSAAPANPPAPGGETVTIPRAELDALKAQQAEMQRQIDELRRLVGQKPPSTAPTPQTSPDENPPPLETPETGTSGGTASGGTASTGSSTPASGNHSLLLPDISFIGQARGLFSTDKRAEDRSSFRLSEGELGIQGYVYPNVKVDAFIVGAPAEDEPFQLEEGYLSFLGVRKGLNVYAGKKFVPFGRTGEQHSHSFAYARQLLPRRNLVAEEALVGDGVNFRYLLPTPGNLYAQLDFGIFAGEGAGSVVGDNGAFNPRNPFGGAVPVGTGAGFTRRFYNSRLYLAHPLGRDGELALGASYARGRSQIDDDSGATLGQGNTALHGLDLTYRRYGKSSKRLLARAEYFGYRPGRGLSTRAANGYYGLLNYRFDPRKDIGLLYERSGFPQAPGQHENALSLIYTKQFTEQFYARLHGTRGRRPGDGSYNEILLQFVFGIGPHTHNLE